MMNNEPMRPIPSERRPATRAEARALAHPLRLRILRLCLDEALTNREIADRLGQQPATVLYHVRTLIKTEFLRREAERRGRRGARELPYRATRKSWALSFEPDSTGQLAMIDAVRAELADAGPDAVLTLSRLGPRLRPEQIEKLEQRLTEIIEQASADDDPAGEPIGLLIALHRRR
ncbi:winged helix-turn-helix domain-containing protein [soil metagenome]